MTLEISAEKRRLASLHHRMVFGELGRAAGCGGAFLLRGGGGGCAGEKRQLEAWVRLAERGSEDAVGIGVEESGEHRFGDCGLNLQRVAGEGEGRVVDGVGGRLLAFDGGEGGDEGGLEGVEVDVGLWCRLDEMRAVLRFRGWFGCEREGAVCGGCRGRHRLEWALPLRRWAARSDLWLRSQDSARRAALVVCR